MTLVIVSTCYDLTLKDVNEKVTSMGKDLILCFSARRNFNTIVEITHGHRGLNTLHLIRFFLMTLTMVGHRTVQYFTGPVLNISYMESVTKKTFLAPSLQIFFTFPLNWFKNLLSRCTSTRRSCWSLLDHKRSKLSLASVVSSWRSAYSTSLMQKKE